MRPTRPSMRRDSTRLPVRHATALGLLHGPAELLPVSSSGHLVLVGGAYRDLDPELRKSFEVALHAGSALGLIAIMRDERLEPPHPLALLPVGAAGLLLERVVEERLGSPRQVALAQVAAGLALAAADLQPATRGEDAAGALDALAIGAAQALALVPGVSRGGASITAMRLLGFDRPAAGRLSRRAALPIVAGATALKGLRVLRRGLPRELAVPFAAGAAAALASTLVSRPLVAALDGARSYRPLAAYRVLLGAVALIRLNWPHGR
jgi:undecaprenyl-diphosphatase